MGHSKALTKWNARPFEKGFEPTTKFSEHDQIDEDKYIRSPHTLTSLAAMEQGYHAVDPLCPTRDYAQNMHISVRRKKSLSSILTMRRDWAKMRQNVDKAVEETLWREDKERMEFFKVQYASLSYLPLAKPYPTHLQHMNQLLAQTRFKRQQTSIFDCELSEWYKYLVIKVQEEVGKKDDEMNELLEKVKVHFKMSPTCPRFAKAKLALITMSMPAYIVSQLHVQRALHFIICQVLEAPETMLIGWLATRGLPFVLLPSHAL